MCCAPFLRRLAWLLPVALLIVASGAPPAPAAQIDVSLNVLYTNPFNDLLGGTWEVVAKSDGFGVLGLQVLLQDIDTVDPGIAGPNGTVNGVHGAGFSEFIKFNHGSYTEVVVGQTPLAPHEIGLGEQSVFYGVGTLANGAPNYPGAPGGTVFIGPAFTSLTPPGISWAAGDALGDAGWDTAAVLVTGTFDGGQTPSFYQSGALISSGSVFTSVGTSTTVGAFTTVDPVSTIVRDNYLGEPGDYNADGTVDAADYTVWRDNLGLMVAIPNDTTPGVVSEVDYDVWKANFGATAIPPGGGAAAVAAVPEPGSWVLLGVAGALFLGRFGPFARGAGFASKKR